MSRIGKIPIIIPENVSIKFLDQVLTVNGKYGTLTIKILPLVKLEFLDNLLKIDICELSKKAKSYYGFIRSHIQNMVIGVDKLFYKILLVEGVGYKFYLKDNLLEANLGFSHKISLIIPKDLILVLESPTKIIIKGIDKQKVGLFASNLRSFRSPEPYKGKGIRYENETILRKVGKAKK